jgi:hypothetical protein
MKDKRHSAWTGTGMDYEAFRGAPGRTSFLSVNVLEITVYTYFITAFNRR